MSSNFDWRAEDDRTWNEYVSPDPGEEQPDSGGERPKWQLVLVASVVVVVVGIFIFFWARRYVENTAESVEEDVLSSHALVKMAAQERDLELLAPLLSGRDPNWTQDQLALLDMNLLLDRQPFDLFWRPEETPDDISVTLSPDLQSAEIEYLETYGYGRNGDEGAIQLTQTAVYRLSETRWLLSPPAEDFWGDWISAKGNYVILTFPERDQELGRRLASDLEAALAGACLNLNLNCGNAPWPVDVLLATDLDAMVDIGSPEHFARGDGQLVLPTPTLLGKPANNASYRALYRGYATYLVSRLVARQAGYECCEQIVFFKALVDVQLQQLGFQTWPLTAEDYREALRRPVELGTVRRIWEEGVNLTELEERLDKWMLYDFIDFLVNQPDSPGVLEWQLALDESESFNDWLAELGITGSLNLMVDDWREFSHERILQTQDQPPLEWPEDDIALICNDGQTGIANIYRYDPAESKWTVELADRDFVVMNGLPNNQGLILTEQYLDVDLLRTTLWREDDETVVTFGEDFFFSAEVSDPDGHYLVLFSFLQDAEAGGFDLGLNLLDLVNCTEENCTLLPIEGEPVWSPDGTRTVWDHENIPNDIEEMDTIFLGDGKAQGGVPIGDGFAPFWLDNGNFAFLVDSTDTVLMAAGVEDRAPVLILEPADLAPFLPDLGAADINLLDAMADPVAPDLIYLAVGNRLTYENFLFTFDWRTGEIALVFTADNGFGDLSLHSFSPDHRWIILESLDPDVNSFGGGQQFIHFYNVQSQETTTYNLVDDLILPPQSWSNNGKWLVFRGNGFLILSAPEAGYDHLVHHDFRDCTDVAWIK